MDEEGKVIYYRWKNARIGIIACEEHAIEVLKALDKAQNESE